MSLSKHVEERGGRLRRRVGGVSGKIKPESLDSLRTVETVALTAA